MNDLLTRLEELRPYIGNTHVKKLEMDFPAIVYAKLEYGNYFGSIKDRAAFFIIAEAIKSGQLTKDKYVIESSSGNFAVALMGICNLLGIQFIPVIDPNINEEYEKILRLGGHVIKVTTPDETGGYLLNRIRKVREIVNADKRAFWTNQYGNVNNYLSYYRSLGPELERDVKGLEYIFTAVSSGGTITGLSSWIKERYPAIKIIAVDIEGSLVFGGAPGKRYISGIGASKPSEFLESANIDEVIYVSHLDIIAGCRELLSKHSLFVGGSSGACYHAVKNYHYHNYSGSHPKVVFICPDKGNAYLNNIYNDLWVEKIKNSLDVILE